MIEIRGQLRKKHSNKTLYIVYENKPVYFQNLKVQSFDYWGKFSYRFRFYNDFFYVNKYMWY